MGKETGIEWTDHTFNPWWGCTKISPGCAHCYAETLDKRVGGEHWGKGMPRREFGDKHWNEPLRWNREAEKAGKRARVFCASMADVFDEEVPDAWRNRLFDLIRVTQWLDWQLLTKRHKNMFRFMNGMIAEQNVWLGVSVEDQCRADERIPFLLETPAHIRFLSIEPLLGATDISDYLSALVSLPGYKDQPRPIGWVIVGGESGGNARPMHPKWVRRLRDQCVNIGKPFFFKQWGEWIPASQTDPIKTLPAGFGMLTPGGKFEEQVYSSSSAAEPMYRVGKKSAGRELDGREWSEFPIPY